MDSLLRSPLGTTLTQAYEAALANRLPLFAGGAQASNPVNSAPYIASIADLQRDFVFTPERERLLSALEALLRNPAAAEVRLLFMIIGGSFINLEVREPKDIDGAIFYSARSDGRPPKALSGVQTDAHSSGVDIRFLPFDNHPVLAAKMIGYFCLLYSQKRRESSNPSVLLVDLSDLDVHELD